MKKLEAVATAFVVGVDADGTECPRGNVAAIVEHKFGTGEHNMAYNAVVEFHEVVQFGDEIGVVAVLVEYVMLDTSGAVDVPERLAREVLYLTIVFGLF